MVRAAIILTLSILVLSCAEPVDVKTDFTGRQQVYALLPGDVYPVTGTAIFKEKKDGTSEVEITLEGTEGTAQYPVHLHLGNIATPSADIFVVLNPVSATTGKATTTVKFLADETPVTYTELTALAACIKIHLAANGPERDIILAGGNVGESAKNADGGRLGMSVCKSN